MVFREELKLEPKLERFLFLEEDYWKTQSQADWLLEGDRNTTFFHLKASQRHKQNTIAKIKDGNGVIHEDSTGIEFTILNYFHSIYTSNNSHVLQEYMIDRTLGIDEISSLEKPFTADEVIHALKQMKGRKAPGPDDLQTCFLHNQSAFVLITYNFIVAFEAFHFKAQGKINGFNHFALKLDLSKAFDRITTLFSIKLLFSKKKQSKLFYKIMRQFLVRRLIWNFTPNGIYMMKLCYKTGFLYMSSTERGDGPSIVDQDAKTWNAIHSIPIQLKIRIFL
ncbi:hypothetical protein M9H77_16207 [Catharanthus roseus]|uniref:Uncharacterized protein n=1 Tax=Catharanthus roseus TaxID=4058 RepID=A0ACC0AZM8_CATRO|nr:hypothetical protein M9H77_16207 [Catharanthus roseus]